MLLGHCRHAYPVAGGGAATATACRCAKAASYHEVGAAFAPGRLLGTGEAAGGGTVGAGCAQDLVVIEPARVRIAEAVDMTCRRPQSSSWPGYRQGKDREEWWMRSQLACLL